MRQQQQQRNKQQQRSTPWTYLHGVAVGVVSLLLGAKARQKHALQPEKFGLLLGVEKLEVGVVDHVQAPAVLPRLLVANDDLFAKLVEGILVEQ